MTRKWYTREEVQSAHFCPTPSFALRCNHGKGRKADGLRFERKAQDHLCALSPWYIPGPWIIFIVDGRPQWCQPDGLDINPLTGVLTIIEIKYTHTAEAHRQLRHVYAPVVGSIFPPLAWTYRSVELVKWYDPDIKFPEPIEMCSDPFAHKSQKIGVHIWRP